MVKSRVMFLGYCMLLHSRTIGRNFVYTPSNTDQKYRPPSKSDMVPAKYRYQKTAGNTLVYNSSILVFS